MKRKLSDKEPTKKGDSVKKKKTTDKHPVKRKIDGVRKKDAKKKKVVGAGKTDKSEHTSKPRMVEPDLGRLKVNKLSFCFAFHFPS